MHCYQWSTFYFQGCYIWWTYFSYCLFRTYYFSTIIPLLCSSPIQYATHKSPSILPPPESFLVVYSPHPCTISSSTVTIVPLLPIPPPLPSNTSSCDSMQTRSGIIKARVYPSLPHIGVACHIGSLPATWTEKSELGVSSCLLKLASCMIVLWFVLHWPSFVLCRLNSYSWKPRFGLFQIEESSSSSNRFASGKPICNVFLSFFVIDLLSFRIQFIVFHSTLHMNFFRM